MLNPHALQLRMTHEEIARGAGVSRRAIQKVESRALKKIRAAIVKEARAAKVSPWEWLTGDEV